MLRLTYGFDTIYLENPEYGYTSTIKMGLHHSEGNGQYTIWDDGAEYDIRTCKARFLLDESFTDAVEWWLRRSSGAQLATFITDADQARAQTVTLNLGSSNEGFFPFGPDKGDTGSFSVRIINWKPGPAEHTPFRKFWIDIEFLLVSAPAYSLPSQEYEGDFQVGNLYNLRFPMDGFNPVHKLCTTTTITRNGTPSTSDIGESCDIVQTSWDQHCAGPNAAALVSFITGEFGRGDDVTIVAPAHYHAFGPGRSNANGSGTYTAKLLQPEIKITHESKNDFVIPLKFWMKTQT